MKSQENQSCRVITNLSEAYTSKTCTNCGHLKEDLKNKNHLKCPICKINIERDFNGALGKRIQLN